MESTSHSLTTQATLEILRRLPGAPDLLSQLPDIALASVDIDQANDLEFVDVEGVPSPADAKDDPHKDDFWAVDDKPHRNELGYNFTSYSHFIDIGKGPGLYDDFDGYSYDRGSGSRDQHQDLADTSYTGSALAGFLLGVLGQGGSDKVDGAIAWWLNDEYVHAPGTTWYRDGCSPALAKYCASPHRVHTGWSLNEECKARFPQTAGSTGQAGKGFPGSVFPPLDNMGRYWYEQYAASRDPKCAGYFLHTIQDATIPQHVTSHTGNWHSEFERALGEAVPGFLLESSFQQEALELVRSWCKSTTVAATLVQADFAKIPSRAWRPDLLITWVALNTYHHAVSRYSNFANGFQFDLASARELTKLSVAMGALMLGNALGWQPPQSWVWNEPRLQVAPRLLDFKRAFSGRLKATCRNVGGQPLTIQEIHQPLNPIFRIVSALPALPLVLKTNESFELEIECDRARAAGRDTARVREVLEMAMSPANRLTSLEGRIEQLAGVAATLSAQDGRVRVVSDCAQSPTDFVYLHADALVSLGTTTVPGFPFDRFRRAIPAAAAMAGRAAAPAGAATATLPTPPPAITPPPGEVLIADVARQLIGR